MHPVHLSESQINEIGATLKLAREKQGGNLAEIAFKIALSPSQLRAIEACDLKPFYSHRYFLQAAERYAGFLGVTLPVRPTETQQALASDLAHDISPRQTATQQATPELVEPSRPVHLESPPDAAARDAAAQDAAAAQPTRPKPTEEPKEKPADKPVITASPQRRSRWGWAVFAVATLLVLGLLKIGLENSPVKETAANQITTSTTPSAEGTAATETEKAGPPTAQASPQGSTVTLAPSPNPSLTPAIANDSHLELAQGTWVQIVKVNGEKINLKAEPGKKIEFVSGTTAAVVFGEPERANLSVRGKLVNLKPFMTQDSPPRALVILNQIKE